MIQMTLTEAAKALGLPSNTANCTFTGICIDSRLVQPGNLFIALPGSKMNGHDFINEAASKGAACALVDHLVETSIPQLQTHDTVAALGALTAHWRNQFHIPFIAVTGSNGKTTAKSMIASILTAACDNNAEKVLSPQGTFNNHTGLPLTLARLNSSHRYAVIEMGMNHFGEIEYLTKLTRPQVAMITNAAESHLEGVGDVAGVARAKAEIFMGLSDDGIAVLNRDDHFFGYWKEIVGKRKMLSFGYHADADVRATIHPSQQTHHVTIHTPKGEITLHLPLLGKHNVTNALSATAATIALDIPLSAVKNGLEQLLPVPGRLQLHKLENGVNIIDDTYNANPFSLQVAIETLANFSGKKILVLGDMKELGNNSKEYHEIAGEKIRHAGIDYLFTFGELSAMTASKFGEGAYHFNEQIKLLNALKPFLHNQATILVKGSRSMRMEKIIAGLLQ